MLAERLKSIHTSLISLKNDRDIHPRTLSLKENVSKFCRGGNSEVSKWLIDDGLLSFMFFANILL